jgi:uncharacterized protein DUF2188
MMSKPKRSKAHVVPEPGPGKKWVVYWYPADEPAGETPGVDVYPKKSDAIREAVSWAKAWPPSQIFIHNGKGVIVDERSYGTDPPQTQGATKKGIRRK